MRFKRTGILTKIILMALLIYAISSLVMLRGQIERSTQRRDALLAEIADITASNEEKQYALEHKDDDAVIEGIARDEGYVYQDEEVFYAD